MEILLSAAWIDDHSILLNVNWCGMLVLWSVHVICALPVTCDMSLDSKHFILVDEQIREKITLF